MKQMTERASKDAFAGESMAHMKYLIYSEIAEKEGYRNAARLFRAIAYAEFVHAKNHAKNLGIIGSTTENLSSSIEGETFEVEEMYPVYLETARLQDERQAEKAFHFAMEAEKIHAEMYRDAKDKVDGGEDIETEEIYICPICGYTHAGAVDTCPVCGYKGEFKTF